MSITTVSFHLKTKTPLTTVICVVELLEHERVDPERRERRRLPMTSDDSALPSDRSSECSSSTLAARDPAASRLTELTQSSGSWSSESIGITVGSGSDSTDFTPGEFSGYPRHPLSSPRPSVGSSGTLHAGGGPYVARITVPAPMNSNPVDTLVLPLVRASDAAPVHRKSSGEDSSSTLPKTWKNNESQSPTSPTDDSNIYVLQSHDGSVLRKSSCPAPFTSHPTTQDNFSASTSPIRGHINHHDGVVQFTAPLELVCGGASDKWTKGRSQSKNGGSPSKRLTNNLPVSTSPIQRHINHHDGVVEFRVPLETESGTSGNWKNGRSPSKNGGTPSKHLPNNLSPSESPIRSRINHDGVVEFIAPLELESGASVKSMNSGSLSKHLQNHATSTNTSRSFTSPKTNLHPLPSEIVVSDKLASQRREFDVSSKYLPMPKAEDHHRSINSAPERQAFERRKGKQSKHRRTEVDGQQSNGNSAVVVDSVVGGYGWSVTKPDGREVASVNEAGGRQSLPGKHDVSHSQASTGDVVTRDALFRRRCDPDASKQISVSAGRSPAADKDDVPGHGFHRMEQQAALVDRQDTGKIFTKTSEQPSTEEANSHRSKLDRMKRFCLEQLARSSKPVPELATRRRGKQRRKTTTRVPGSPDSVRTLTNGTADPHVYASDVREVNKYSVSTAIGDRDNEGTARDSSLRREYSSPHEYASRHKYSSHSTTTTTRRDCLPQRITDTNKHSSETSRAEKTKLQQHAIRHRGNTQTSQNSDRPNSQIVANNSERRLNPTVRPSPEEDTLSTVTARTDYSSASGAVNAFSHSGRLSITITNNGPESEMERTIDVGQMSVSFRRGSEEKTYRSQLYAVLSDGDVINQKFHEGQEISSSDADDDDDCDCSKSSSSSEATISGSVACRGESVDQGTMTRPTEHFHHPTGRHSNISTSSHVDAAVQVEVEELQPGSRHAAICRPTSKTDRTLRSGHFRTISPDPGRTPDWKSLVGWKHSASESKEYGRRSGKDVWTASLAIHGSGNDDSTDRRSESHSSTSKRSTVKKSGHRRHRHTVASIETEHPKQLGSSSHHSSGRERTAEAVPAEIRRSSDMKGRNATEGVCVEGRQVTANGKDRDRPADDTRSSLIRKGDLDADLGRRNTPRGQTSSVVIQPPMCLLDTSPIHVVVREVSEERGCIVNRTPNGEVTEKQMTFEKTSDHKSRETQQRELLKDIGAHEVSNTMMTSGDSKPHSQTAEHNPVKNSEPDVTVPSPFNASLVDAAFVDRRQLKDFEVVDAKSSATVEVGQTPEKSGLANEDDPADHRRYDGLLQAHSPSNDPSTRSPENGAAETCRREASAVTTGTENILERGKPDMANATSADSQANGDIFSSSSNATLIQPVQSPPERTSFFSRLIKRWA